MTWPKKGTRKLVIDNKDYLWHYDAHCPLCSSDVFTIGRPGKKFVLFIDPNPWGFELRPASVVAAITWALKKGWSPDSGPNRSIAWNDKTQEYEWLPDGKRHLACNSKPVSTE
ncbi:MAG: hypothetical protein SVY10_02350 [Thermodesulfobacteriota bacterium]|nr:hypothetical protein [Thermodesulfobacteriota bacterium]